MKDDTINRQSTIDTIHKTICGFFDVAEDDSEEPISEKDKLLLEVNKAICNGIKELPSSQPESRREWYMKGYRDAQQWIPVSEALPDKYIEAGDGKHYSQDVMMTVIHRSDEDIIIDCGQMVDDEWYSEIVNEIITSPFEVVAWMPLPEPYKGGEK